MLAETVGRDLVAEHAGAPVILTDPQVAVEFVQRLAGKTVGFDIETYGTSDHPSAGLDPRVSAIRLGQFFDEEDRAVHVIDCRRAGTDWARHLPAVRLVAHNASFEISHLQKLTPERLSFDCTMLAGRVLYGKNRSLKDLVHELLGCDLSKELQKSDWAAETLSTA